MSKRIVSKIMLTLLLVSVLTLAFNIQPVKASSLVGHWRLDEGSGTTAIDSSGNGNTGNLTNGPTWVDGKYGKALSFDGINDYVRVNASSSLNVTAQVTVEAWVYPNAYNDSSGSDSHIVSRCDIAGGHIYVLGTWQNGTVQYSVNPSPPAHSSVATLPLNTWTHLAMTYNGTYVMLYINGTLDSNYTLSGPISTTTNWLAIGCKPVGPSQHFNGTVDDVRIYNVALSQLEIQGDMGGHDISIISVTPNTPHQYPGRIVNITVVIKNNGSVSETFNVTAYRNSTVIGTTLVTNLTVGENRTLIFNWNTLGLTPCQNWTIRAEAPLIGDANPSDNNVTNGTVKIKMLGDVNSDGVINLHDLVEASMAFGSVPGSWAWDPQADILQDGVINVVDFVRIAQRFGQSC